MLGCAIGEIFISATRRPAHDLDGAERLTAERRRLAAGGAKVSAELRKSSGGQRSGSRCARAPGPTSPHSILTCRNARHAFHSALLLSCEPRPLCARHPDPHSNDKPRRKLCGRNTARSAASRSRLLDRELTLTVETLEPRPRAAGRHFSPTSPQMCTAPSDRSAPAASGRRSASITLSTSRRE